MFIATLICPDMSDTFALEARLSEVSPTLSDGRCPKHLPTSPAHSDRPNRSKNFVACGAPILSSVVEHDGVARRLRGAGRLGR